jgi:membrane protein
MPLLETVFLLAPMVLTWATFTLLYLIIPNTRVPLRFALLGGFVAGTLWEVAKIGYTSYAARAISYSAIYGSLSVVPLFMIWIFVSWMVVLIGAQMTFASQNARTYEPNQDLTRLSVRERERLALVLLLRIHQRFAEGRGGSPVGELISGTSGPPSALRRILSDLQQGGLLLETASPGGPSYVPGRAADKTALDDVLTVLRGGQSPSPSQDRLESESSKLLEEAWSTERAFLAGRTIEDLLPSAAGVPSS